MYHRTSPYLTENGKLLKQIENPHSKDKHHNNPDLIVKLLPDVKLLIAKNMGENSRYKLATKLGVKSMLVDAKDIFEAINQYLETKKNIKIFGELTNEYEQWFDRNKAVYESEINMLKSIMPKFERGIEIGVGSGRFAYPLGIKEGVEPSEEMAKVARKRGITICPGFAESLPVPNETYDLALLAVTLCFVKDPAKALSEANRILKSNGTIIVAIVDRNSPMGKEYLNKKETSKFYKNAHFFSTEEVQRMLKDAGFNIINTYQTLFGNSIKDINHPHEFREGHGEGGFVAIVGKKP